MIMVLNENLLSRPKSLENHTKGLHTFYFKKHRYIQTFTIAFYKITFVRMKDMALFSLAGICGTWCYRFVSLLKQAEKALSASLDLGHRYLRINQGSNCVTQMILKLNQLNCRSVIKYLCILLVATEFILQLL